MKFKRFPRHVFISYSSKDNAVVQTIYDELEKSEIYIWWDKNIEPDSPNYNRDIQTAIEQAWAMIYVVSPNSLESDYVLNELMLAKQNGITIIPIWIWGDTWIDSVKPELSTTQGIDGRDNPDKETNLQNAIAQLIEQLNEIKQNVYQKVIQFDIENDDRYRHEYTYISYKDKHIALRLDLMTDILDLVDTVYLRLLSETHKPDYGVSWLLGVKAYNNKGIIQLIIPPTWMYPENKTIAIPEYDMSWYRKSLNDALLSAHNFYVSELEIIDLKNPDKDTLCVLGISCRNFPPEGFLLRGAKARYGWLRNLISQQPINPKDISFIDYPYFSAILIQKDSWWFDELKLPEFEGIEKIFYILDKDGFY